MTATTHPRPRGSRSPLSSHELWLFRLTASVARSPQAQRQAIARAGLTGMTRREVLAARRAAWAEYRQRPQNRGLPSWLVARRALDAGGDWRSIPPVPAGTLAGGASLAREAYDRADWGRARKRDWGRATSSPPAICERDNGRTGWDRVVWRYANYLAVLSPDGTRIAVQTHRSDPVTIARVWRGRCLIAGRAVTVTRVPPLGGLEPPPSQCPQRVLARRLRAQGLDARLVRQTRDQVSAGSGDSLRTGGDLYVVVPTGDGSWLHCTYDDTAGGIAAMLRRRAVAARATALDQQIEADGGAIWVAVSDSIAAGNCQAGTAAFAAELSRHLCATGEIGAVTARAILAFRRDPRAVSACRVAALRYSRSGVNAPQVVAPR